jgi:hypothetical protein
MRRRRRITTASFVVALVLASTASAARRDVATGADDVLMAVVGAAVYAEEHGGSYTGMTVAKMRRWVNVKNVVVRRATRRGYCLQSIKGRVMHFDGPSGPLRYGRCGTRGAVVPRPKPKPPVTEPKPSGDAAIAERQLRNATFSALAYYADHDSYLGLTLEKLQNYDKEIAGITIEWSTAKDFCIQSTVGTTTYRVLGADFKPAPGACPAPPR